MSDLILIHKDIQNHKYIEKYEKNGRTIYRYPTESGASRNGSFHWPVGNKNAPMPSSRNGSFHWPVGNKNAPMPSSKSPVSSSSNVNDKVVQKYKSLFTESDDFNEKLDMKPVIKSILRETLNYMSENSYKLKA